MASFRASFSLSLLAAFASLGLSGCLFDPGSDAPQTHFDFSVLDTLPGPLARWYDVPAGKSLVAVQFAFTSLDYGHDADSNIAAFAAEAGGPDSLRPAVAGAYVDFKVNPTRLKAFLDTVHARGCVPYLTFDPKDFAGSDVASQYAYVAQIPQGTWDVKLKEVAGVLRAFGHPVLLRFAHEMNGNWYPYSGVFYGGGSDADHNGVADGPQKYITAWRYVHALFAAEGATQIAWVYSPNAESYPSASWNAPFAYYPGSAYVDLIAVDVYEHPDKSRQGLAALMAPVYNELGLFYEAHAGDTAYALRPFGLAEYGTARKNSTEKGDWYADAFQALASDPRVTFHALYNARNGSQDFSITGLGGRLAAVSQDSRFAFGPLSARAVTRAFARRAD